MITSINTTKQELTELITNMRKEVLKDITDDTQIPKFYKELLADLDKAQHAVDKGDFNLCFDIIGEINLDMLEMVDDLDDVIGITIQNLYAFQKNLKLKGETLPENIHELLKKIQALIRE